jgi:hypothetical protein
MTTWPNRFAAKNWQPAGSVVPRRQAFDLPQQVIQTVTQGVGLVQVDTAVAQQPGLEAMGALTQCTPASLRLRCTSRSSLALRWRLTSAAAQGA